MPDIHPEVMKAVPGAAGSLVSMLFIKETWPRRIALFLAGAALSFYGTPWLQKVVALDAGFAGFLLGMTGMAVIAKLFAAWDSLELGSMLRDFLRQLFRLPPKEQ